jgi:glycosyltransferase involved in cell wall biosynthesis
MNQTGNFEFTIIVPVYNERENIGRLEKELAGFLPTAAMRSCVLFVDDGSKDGSTELIKEVCERHGDMFYIALARNTGLSGAMKAGIDHVQSPWLGYIDADLQTTPGDFNLLLEQARAYALVMGIRTGRKDSFVKRASSRFANGFRRMMTHDGVEDTGCPLKVMRTDYARRIPFFTGMHRFLPALVQLQEGGTVCQIPVRHFPRIAGKSKYHLWNRLAGPLKDCFAYRWMRRRWIEYKVGESDL